MTIKALDHVNIETADLAGTVAFYTEVIGLSEGPRPSISRPGAWLYCGERPVIHLMQAEAGQEASTGPIDHVAFEAEDFDGMAARLGARGLSYSTNELPDISLRQIFVRDPNGVKIELNFRG